MQCAYSYSSSFLEESDRENAENAQCRISLFKLHFNYYFLRFHELWVNYRTVVRREGLRGFSPHQEFGDLEKRTERELDIVSLSIFPDLKPPQQFCTIRSRRACGSENLVVTSVFGRHNLAPGWNRVKVASKTFLDLSQLPAAKKGFKKQASQQTFGPSYFVKASETLQN